MAVLKAKAERDAKNCLKKQSFQLTRQTFVMKVKKVIQHTTAETFLLPLSETAKWQKKELNL